MHEFGFPQQRILHEPELLTTLDAAGSAGLNKLRENASPRLTAMLRVVLNRGLSVPGVVLICTAPARSCAAGESPPFQTAVRNSG